MRVFLAGGTGAIGVPLVKQLVAASHQVTALTRSSANAATLRALGATPAVADALDAEALRRAVIEAKPTHVIHQLTALPKGGPRSARELEPTNRLRTEGTRNLIEAAVAAGATRLVVGSFAIFRGAPSAEVPPDAREASDAVRSMESQTLDASRSGRIEGVILRYGLFYGPETGSTVQMIAMIMRETQIRIILTPFERSAVNSLSAERRPKTRRTAVSSPQGIVKISENGRTYATKPMRYSTGKS